MAMPPETIAADAANPAAPKTVFGLILAGLARRRDRGIAPFTVMSCDNIPGNGEVARRMIVAFARLKDPELADWIDQPSLLVRITHVERLAGPPSRPALWNEA